MSSIEFPYNNIKNLKKLYKSFYHLENMKYKGDEDAISLYLDLSQALNPLRRITTLKQRYVISEVLINGKPIQEVAQLLNISLNTMHSHLNGGLKRILIALNDGSVYHNKYYYIIQNYKRKPIKQIAIELNINENTVKSIIRRLKNGGYITP